MLLAAAFWLAAFWPKDLYQPMNTTASVFFQLSSKNETTVPPEPPYPFKACVKSWCSGTLNWSAASVISQRNAEMVGRLFVPGCSVTAFLGGFTSGRIPLYIYILVGGREHELCFPIQLGMSSSQLTNSYLERGCSTTNQVSIYLSTAVSYTPAIKCCKWGK